MKVLKIHTIKPGSVVVIDPFIQPIRSQRVVGEVIENRRGSPTMVVRRLDAGPDDRFTVLKSMVAGLVEGLQP